jgi:hypothetical protein
MKTMWLATFIPSHHDCRGLTLPPKPPVGGLAADAVAWAVVANMATTRVAVRTTPKAVRAALRPLTANDAKAGGVSGDIEELDRREGTAAR